MRFSVFTLAALSAFVSLAFALASAANAMPLPSGQSICEELLTRTEVELAAVRPDFEHNTEYSVEVKSTPIDNQCQSRSCWVFSGVSNIEQRLLTKSGKSVDLSEEFLIIHAARIRALEALETPGQQFTPGGQAVNVDMLVETFGAVPESAWKPRVNFTPAPVSSRFYYYLNARIAKYHLEVASHPERKPELLAQARAELLEIIESYSGKLPESFEYEGERYASPKDFAAREIPSDGRDVVKLVPKGVELPEPIAKLIEELEGPGSPHGTSQLKHPHTVAKVSYERMAQRIKEAIERGESVRISYQSVHEFMDPKTGIMSIAAFYAPKGFSPPPAKYRDSVAFFQATGHAVEVVGVDVAADGSVVKFKIKNSHGAAAGDHGFLHMYRDYFEAFVTGAYIRKGPATP